METKEESYRKGLKLSHFDLCKQLTEAKKEFTWLSKVNAQSLQAVLERLDLGYKKFFTDLKTGKKCSKPRWAKKGKFQTIVFKQGNLMKLGGSLRRTEKGFLLPSFGEVKVFNKEQQFEGIIKQAKLTKKADGLYLNVVVETAKPDRENQPDNIAAIDMGINCFYVTSDGEFVDNPKHLFQYLKQLRIENRKLSRMKKGGNNFRKQVKVLQLLHQKVSRVRKDFLHKKSRYLADNYGTIIREDLNISKMVKGSNYAKHILDCSWGNN